MKSGFAAAVLASLVVASCGEPPPLYRSDAFTVTGDGVVEGPFRAEVTGEGAIRSNFGYAAALRPRAIQFKFALNGRDNEAPPGQDHVLYLVPEDGRLTTPVLTFGRAEPAENPPVEPPALERPIATPVEVTFRVDLSAVLDAFAAEGVYRPSFGDPVRAADFDGVYIAGSEHPLSWDFNAFAETQKLSDADGDGIYEVTLTFGASNARPFDDEGFAVWSAPEHPGLPTVHSDQPLVDALHRLSLDEMRQDIRPDGAFMAGAKWEGVWTRDISYSILLSLAFLDPETSRRSLMAKVSDGRIVQDTGTGGSWPVSSDRVTWALAAWEVYLATGDETWLTEVYDIVSRSVEADLAATFDAETGLFFGESSFLDWREQSYPAWMDPKDVYRSQCLGTNAVFFRTFSILAEMARELGEPADRWDSIAVRVREGMNTLLWDGSGYGQYRYGRLHPTLSPRREALGAALSVLFGVPDEARADSVLADLPLTAYGVPTIWPQIPGIPPYHNDSVWPFVVAYSAWAAAEAGNSAVVEHSLGSIYRAAALFLTNKENLVASTGHFDGTQINSDRQLWSVAGTLATVYRVLFGIRMHPDRLEFRPFVPLAYDGERRVENLRWRGALLTVTVEGFGDAPESVELDGRPVSGGSIPASLTGPHEVVIRMNGRIPVTMGRLVATEFAPATPVAEASGDSLRWVPIEGASGYGVVRDGTVTRRIAAGSALVHPLGALPAEFQVLAEAANGQQSFLSEPIRLGYDETLAEPRQAMERRREGWLGAGYLTLSTYGNRSVYLRLTVPEPGRYLVDVRYANGSGPINTDNKAAVRSLFVDSKRVGTIVMPQRGTDRWDDWGFSNGVPVDLTAGAHLIELRLSDLDRNMSGTVNTALLDHVRLTRIDGPTDETH